jgi:hypothetical protein
MTETTENRNYSDLTAYTTAINETMRSIRGHVFVIGENLQRAFETIKGKKSSTWKAWVESDLDISQSTAEKMRRIYRKETLRENKEYLPAEWATLNQLAFLDDDTIGDCISKGKIHPTMSRSDAAFLRRSENDTAPTEFILAKVADHWDVDKAVRFKSALEVRLDEVVAFIAKAELAAVKDIAPEFGVIASLVANDEGAELANTG